MTGRRRDEDAVDDAVDDGVDDGVETDADEGDLSDALSREGMAAQTLRMARLARTAQQFGAMASLTRLAAELMGHVAPSKPRGRGRQPSPGTRPTPAR
jgi:hypothetical protein